MDDKNRDIWTGKRMPTDKEMADVALRLATLTDAPKRNWEEWKAADDRLQGMFVKRGISALAMRGKVFLRMGPNISVWNCVIMKG
jgi:hypothetical protein